MFRKKGRYITTIPQCLSVFQAINAARRVAPSRHGELWEPVKFHISGSVAPGARKGGSTAVPLTLHRHTGLDSIFMSPLHQALYFPSALLTTTKLRPSYWDSSGVGPNILHYFENHRKNGYCVGQDCLDANGGHQKTQQNARNAAL